MKKYLTAGVAVLCVWLAYSRGYNHGSQDERRAWEATEQPEQPGTVTLNNETAHVPIPAVYRNPHAVAVTVTSGSARTVNGSDRVR
jgi:hypothetical protein